MQLEYDVLGVLLDDASYGVYRRYIQQGALSPPARLVLGVVDGMRGAGVRSTLSPEDIEVFASSYHPEWEEDKEAAFKTGLRLLTEAEGDAAPVIKLWVEREYAAKVADLSDKYAENPSRYKGGYWPELNALYQELQQSLDRFRKDDPLELSATFEDTLNRVKVAGQWQWRLRCLNKAIGPVYPGFFAVIGGRPEAGKTTLLASELGYLAPQMPKGSVIALFNNESNRDILRFRVMQSVIGWSKRAIEADLRRAQREYDQRMDGRHILIRDVHERSVSDVERVLQQYGDRVTLIAFDQASKLTGYEKQAGNSAERLEHLSRKLRALATVYAPVVTTIWADGTAEGEAYIDMNQLYGSKTGVVGEADVILGLGHTHKPEDEGVRYINIPKNKSLTCADESVRHSKWMVLMDSVHARVADPETRR